jgi:hypothetical protein
MAHDALAAYQADVDAGKDALLIADSWELADALNRRIHDQRIDPDAPTVTAARGQRLAAGDIIITGHNDPTIATERRRPRPRSRFRRPGAQWQPLDRDRGRCRARADCCAAPR